MPCCPPPLPQDRNPSSEAGTEPAPPLNSSSSNADRTFVFLRDLSFLPPNYVLIHLLLSPPFSLLHRRNHQPRKTQRGLLFCSGCQSPATFPSFDFHVFFLYRSARSPLNVACAHQCYGDDERVESAGQTDRQASVSAADTCQRCSLRTKAESIHRFFLSRRYCSERAPMRRPKGFPCSPLNSDARHPANPASPPLCSGQLLVSCVSRAILAVLPSFE